MTKTQRKTTTTPEPKKEEEMKQNDNGSTTMDNISKEEELQALLREIIIDEDAVPNNRKSAIKLHSLIQSNQPKTNITILTRSKLDKLICGYIRNQNIDKLYVLKQLFIDYSLCMTQNKKYFGIIISKNPNQHLGDREDKKFEEIQQIEKNIPLEYRINEDKCLNCLHSKENILKLHCYYHKNAAKKYRGVNGFANNVIEYQCIDCKYYIAFNYKKKIQEYESIGGGRECRKIEISLFGDKKCSNSDSERRERGTNYSSEYCSDCNGMMLELESISNPIPHGFYKKQRYFCKNCQLVLLTEERCQNAYGYR